MKKQGFFRTIIFVVMLAVLNNAVMAQSKNLYVGDWEGKFMGDFTAIIKLYIDDRGDFNGNILMYAGDNQIQNDHLSKISLVDDQLTFFIPAKETQFEGSFNEEKVKLSGDFVFPDGSKHPITVFKPDSNQNVPPSTSESCLELKQKKYSQEELKDDLNFLMNKLLESHPQPYFFTSKISMDNLVKHALKNIHDDMTLQEFFIEISPIVEAVKCSHTGLRLPINHHITFTKMEQSFPLKLVIRGTKAYFLSALCKERIDILPGSEITSINGTQVDEILKQLFMFISVEGNNTSTKYNELNRHFNKYLQLLFDSEIYVIEYSALGEKQSIKVKGIESNTFNSDVIGALPLDFFLDSDSNVGFIKIRAFEFDDINTYIQQSDSIFKTLKEENIGNLVLDLRDNSGGHPIFAAQLFSYLTDHDFTYFKQNSNVPEFAPLYQPMQPSQFRVCGNIFVLVNGGSLSTTGHLISLIKYHTDAIFIGEEPGSTFYCCDNSMQLALPNTGIEANIPRSIFETAVSGFDRNQPFPLDYRLDISIEKLVAGRDDYMDFVINLIRENN